MPGEPKNEYPFVGQNLTDPSPDDRAGMKGAAPMSGAVVQPSYNPTSSYFGYGSGGTSGGGGATGTSGGGVAAGGGSPVGQPFPDLFQIRTDADLQRIAEQQIGSEIEGAVSPLQSQVTGLESKEGRVLGDIGNMFDKLQPSVQAAADAVRGSWADAQNVERQIFATATQRLNDLKQQRAVEAQTLAQQMGGPVALGEFTESVMPQMSELANLGAGQQLHTLAYGQAGVQQAEAFAGRVFPLLRTEETAKARTYYEDQISDLNRQIGDLRAQKGAKVNVRANELQAQEREYQLKNAQFKLDQVKADHDWQVQLKTINNNERQLKLETAKFNADRAATRQTLKNDTARLKLAQSADKREWGQLGLDTKKVNADIAANKAAEKRLTADQRLEAKKYDLSFKEYEAGLKHQKRADALAQNTFNASQANTYAQWMDAALSPTAGKTVTRTVPVPLSKEQIANAQIPGMDDKARFIKDKDHPKGYWVYLEQVKEPTAGVQQISPDQPGALVDFLRSHGVPMKTAVSMVKTRLRLPNWVYGEQP